MKKSYLLLLLILTPILVLAQINPKDSTVQTIGYWKLHDKETFTITENSYQVKNTTDTTKRQVYTYKVDVEIIDSTTNSYTIKWLYRDFAIKETWNPLLEKIILMSNNLPIIFKTDEYGTFQEVVNWEEGRDFLKKSGEMMKNEYKDIQDFSKVIDQLVETFSSKEAIENTGIEEIKQFYAFHGVKYKLGEDINANIKVPNNYGSDAIDAELTAELYTINSEDNNYVLQLWQTANPTQVTDAAFGYVNKLQETMKLPLIEKDEFPLSINETRTTSCIDGPSGWIIYSIQSKEISLNNVEQFSDRSIEID